MAGITSILPGAGAFTHRGYRLFWLARVFSTFAALVISVAVGWQVYDITRDPFDLGLVGLIQFAPSLLLVLVTGTISDRFNRRMIISICQIAEGIAALVLLLLTWHGSITVGQVFLILVVFGVARAFLNPAAQSLVPNVVPPQDLSSAIAWNSSAWQLATILGPVAGGLLYGISAEAAYGAAFVLFVAAGIAVAFIPKPAQKTSRERPTWSTLIAGFEYVWRTKIVFGAISLDLFAVLLGGATALLPAYARDILQVGPWGLGLLRAAPGLGAIAMVLFLAFRPVRDHAGRIMFVAVAVFGIFTIVFGASKLVWLSVIALVVMGAADMISVYVRETLIQLWTPDEVRGRVSAVNMLFVGASNEVGEFRAGTVGALIGVVPAVVLGGIGTVLVAALWARWFPQLRKVRHLDAPRTD
ncbi:MAG: MFS transporter [Rhizobiales bacterium]|nr:MFS transporter [Hyphomicrobiales bacterium]